MLLQARAYATRMSPPEFLHNIYSNSHHRTLSNYFKSFYCQCCVAHNTYRRQNFCFGYNEEIHWLVQIKKQLSNHHATKFLVTPIFTHVYRKSLENSSRRLSFEANNHFLQTDLHSKLMNPDKKNNSNSICWGSSHTWTKTSSFQSWISQFQFTSINVSGI